jgi:hypothetical protein
MRTYAVCLITSVLVASACGSAPTSHPITVTPDPIGTVTPATKTITIAVPSATAGFTVRVTIQPGSNGYSSSIQADQSVTPPITGGTTQTKDISTGAATVVLIGTQDGNDEILIEILDAGGAVVNSVTMPYETTNP